MTATSVLSLALLLLAGWGGKSPDRKLNSHDFSSARQCAVCHTEIYEQWSRSTHSQSFTDPVFRTVLKKVLAQEGGKQRAVFCLRCHAPVAGVAGDLAKRDVANSDFTAVESEGVTCDFCHTISGQERLGTKVTPVAYLFRRSGFTGTKYGRLVRKETEAHPTKVSSFLTDSQICAICHAYRHPVGGVEIQNTYREWLGSSHRKQGERCQDCHMPVYSGSLADDSPRSQELHAHVFLGGHSRDIYKQAAVVGLETSLDKKGAKLNVTSRVSNVGAGHAIPTGMPGLRELRLVLAVIRPDGQEVASRTYRYGQRLLDRNNDERLPWEPYRVVKDDRIQPGGFRRENLEVPLKGDLAGELKVEARLYLSRVSETIASRLDLSPPELLLMCSAEKTVNLQEGKVAQLATKSKR